MDRERVRTMAGKDEKTGSADPFTEMFRIQQQATQAMLDQFAGFATQAAAPLATPDPSEFAQWADAMQRLQALMLDFQPDAALAAAPRQLTDPSAWLELVEGWYRQMPFADAETQARMWADGVKLWQGVLGQFTGEQPQGDGGPDLPRKDRRFADPRWREQPVFALVHQAYLLFSEQLAQLADKAEGLDPDRKEQLRFATRTLTEALSPANFPLTNPVVLEKTIETKGENLVKGMEHLLTDLKKGQLTHTDPTAFELGRNIAMTPGKVVHETPLFQLIQYSPTTESVLEVPLVIFPPWINRFYILDLNPAKSFVRWAVEQGITVFMVSWKSADASMAEVVWDDYIRAQIEAIDHVRERLGVPAVHAIGYCVAGTTLAATLAVLCRRGEGDKVKSATFFTAQVDFEEAGELRNFIDDQQLAALKALGSEGYLDGRIMAATFNMLRSSDLIWNYVIDNYLLGKDYPAFDLLYWNGDTTNLPAKWHNAYLCDLYRDNKLVVPDALSGDGTPIDLTRITVPCFIQAGREDHIAPPESVWKITRHLRGPWTFMLAGSGHIAGVVNPPAAGKYQYWTNPEPGDSLADFVAGAQEHPGSWWGYWLGWIEAQDAARVPAGGKRVPGGKGDCAIEDAPGRYVRMP
ncbi:alpha/beta hydrolase [Novosphingobium sp. TH158]|uniref:PHA/PHB synthase family protein n=1 Tax=Novosphingobium sp. TH158 TaxID=2067455 RepID=UPI000C7E1364|nr:class I poly(R)-hydroxyalkanoic acid synthase [Novosphingobium sp. TH158]PLK27921.1 class I poly(R)-hydroxyalkanoic acid synthase [Novosphingobium sp. TH158]